MTTEDDLELAQVLSERLRELLPGFEIDDSDFVAYNAIKVMSHARDRIAFLKITHQSIKLLAPKSMSAYTRGGAAKFKSTAFDYSDPNFSMEKLAKSIRGEYDAEK